MTGTSETSDHTIWDVGSCANRMPGVFPVEAARPTMNNAIANVPSTSSGSTLRARQAENRSILFMIQGYRGMMRSGHHPRA